MKKEDSTKDKIEPRIAKQISRIEQLATGYHKEELANLLLETCDWLELRANSEVDKHQKEKIFSKRQALNLINQKKRIEQIAVSLGNTLASLDNVPEIMTLKYFQQIATTKLNLEQRDVDEIVSWWRALAMESSSIEKKYDVLHYETFIKHAKDILMSEPDKFGAFAELDLVGLKAFNTFSPKDGDQALLKIANLCKEVLKKLGKEQNPDLLVGRRGDEFFIFAPDTNPAELNRTLNQLMKSMKPKLYIEVKDSSQNKIKLEITVYGKVSENKITIENFAQEIIRVEELIEEIKENIANKIIDSIKEIENKEVVYAMILGYLGKKRVSDKLRKLILEISNNDKEATKRIARFVNSPKIQDLLEEIIANSTNSLN